MVSPIRLHFRQPIRIIFNVKWLTLKMSDIGGLFLPLRGKINLKTDAPDGIERDYNK